MKQVQAYVSAEGSCQSCGKKSNKVDNSLSRNGHSADAVLVVPRQTTDVEGLIGPLKHSITDSTAL